MTKRLTAGKGFHVNGSTFNELRGALPLWQAFGGRDVLAGWVSDPNHHVFFVISTRRHRNELQYLVVSTLGIGWFSVESMKVTSW